MFSRVAGQLVVNSGFRLCFTRNLRQSRFVEMMTQPIPSTNETGTGTGATGGGGESIQMEGNQSKKEKAEIMDKLTTDNAGSRSPNPSPDKLYKTIELELLAYEPSVLDSYQYFILTSANYLNLNVGKVWQPFRFSRHLSVVNKSAFVHKKARLHYEVRTYHRFINLHKLTGSTADTFIEYIERNLPEGVGLRVTKLEVRSLDEFLKTENLEK